MPPKKSSGNARKKGELFQNDAVPEDQQEPRGTYSIGSNATLKKSFMMYHPPPAVEELLRHAKNFFTCSGRLVQEGHHSKLTDQTGHLVAQTMKLLEKWNEELLVECNGPDDDKDDDRMLFVLSQALETIDAITGLKKPSTSGGKTVHWEDEASITNRTHDKGESKIAGEPLPHQIPPIPNAKHENTPARLNRLSGELDDVDEGLEDDPAEHPPKSDHAASS